MTKNETLSMLHGIDTEYCIRKRDAIAKIIEARHALREKNNDRAAAESALQDAQDSYNLLNMEHQAERARAWANMDRPEDEESIEVVKERLFPQNNAQEDGIYFILEDGRSCLRHRLGGSGEGFVVDEGTLFANNGLTFEPKDVKYIGIKMGQTKIAVSLKEQECTLVRKDAKKMDEEPSYTNNWEQARIFRLDGKEDTRYIVAQGTDIKLAPNEYIPSLWELNLIYLNRYLVDEALDFLGAEKLHDEWYWSSTHRSADYAWLLPFNYGIQTSYTKSTYRYRVRPVSAIIW